MNAYLTFKALHLIAVISWFAGLLYLPRIFVYHANTSNNEQQNETFKIMERKLYFLHHEPCNDIVLDIWHVVGTFYRYSKFLSIVASNKIISCNITNYLPLLFAPMFKGIQRKL